MLDKISPETKLVAKVVIARFVVPMVAVVAAQYIAKKIDTKD